MFVADSYIIWIIYILWLSHAHTLIDVLSQLSFDEITTEQVDAYTTQSIGWIKMFSCIEGSSATPTTYHNSLLSEFQTYAISVKLVPPGSKTNANYDNYAVVAKPCSNPVLALNHNFELSFVFNEGTELITGYANTDNWIGTTTAKDRLSNSCGTSGPSPQSWNSVIYHACGNGAGLHVIPSSPQCSWNFQDILGEDIEVYFGFDVNKEQHCNTPHRQIINGVTANCIYEDSTSPSFDPSKFSYTSCDALNDNQLWELADVTNEWFRLINKKSTCCLELNAGSNYVTTPDGTIFGCNLCGNTDADSQYWMMETHDATSFRLKNKLTGYCMFQATDGRFGIGLCNAYTDQTWRWRIFSDSPTVSPTKNPTNQPTFEPTIEPTKKSTANPTTSNPTTANPTSSNPATSNSATAVPTTSAPTTANPTTANPTTADPTTANPTTDNPTEANPTTANPTDPTATPTIYKPPTYNPTTATPTADNPTTANPTTYNPTISISTTSNPTSFMKTTTSSSAKDKTTTNTPSKSPTSRYRNMHFICHYNDDIKLALNSLSFSQYAQIMGYAVLYSIKQITLQSTNYDEYQYNPNIPWKKAGILDFIICNVFDFELIIDGECPSYSDSTNDAEYTAIGTFEFVVNDALNAYKKYIVDIMVSDEFKNKFTENMNDKINNSTGNRRMLLEYDSFEAIDIDIIDPLNKSLTDSDDELKNVDNKNDDMNTIIIIIVVCLVIIITIFAVFIYVKRIRGKNKNIQQNMEGGLEGIVGYNDNGNNGEIEMGEEHNSKPGNEGGITQNIHDSKDQDIGDIVNETQANNDCNEDDYDIIKSVNETVIGDDNHNHDIDEGDIINHFFT